MQVKIAKTDTDIRACWPVIVQLRPHLQEGLFVRQIRRQMAEGYQLAYIRTNRHVVALAGFRFLHGLAWGHYCYVDDLVTDEKCRSRGHGAVLMDWLCSLARSKGCARLELESGVQRHAAHRFYLRQRMFISCYHFSLELTPEQRSPSAPNGLL